MPVLPDGTHLPYPGDPGFAQLPPQAQALIQQMTAAQGQGGGGMPGGMPPGPPPGMPQPPAGDSPAPPEGGDDWLVQAINSVHNGMVQEGDPKQVSLLGAILNQLTTFQANQHAARGPQSG